MSRIYFVISFTLFCIHSISGTKYTCDPSASCGCLAPSTDVTARIVGGELAPQNTWGWMVSLQRVGSHICGATLISDEYAITAGHCYSNEYLLSDYSILVGTNYLFDTTSVTIQRRKLIGFYVNPNFNIDALTNDIAILHFSPLTITSNPAVSVICLPTAGEDPFFIGSNLVAIGWGTTDESNTDTSPYLLQGTLKALLATSGPCTTGNVKDPTIEICAGILAGGKDTCHGDSGGPLMAFLNNTWILAGITSSGSGCAEPNKGGSYTRVSAFIPFIQNLTNSSGIIVPSLPESTTMITTQTRQSTASLKTNRADNQKSFLVESIIVFIFWLLVTMNI